MEITLSKEFYNSKIDFRRKIELCRDYFSNADVFEIEKSFSKKGLISLIKNEKDLSKKISEISQALSENSLFYEPQRKIISEELGRLAKSYLRMQESSLDKVRIISESLLEKTNEEEINHLISRFSPKDSWRLESGIRIFSKPFIEDVKIWIPYSYLTDERGAYSGRTIQDEEFLLLEKDYNDERIESKLEEKLGDFSPSEIVMGICKSSLFPLKNGSLSLNLAKYFKWNNKFLGLLQEKFGKEYFNLIYISDIGYEEKNCKTKNLTFLLDYWEKELAPFDKRLFQSFYENSVRDELTEISHIDDFSEKTLKKAVSFMENELGKRRNLITGKNTDNGIIASYKENLEESKKGISKWRGELADQIKAFYKNLRRKDFPKE